MTVLIDADACPVTRLATEIAKKHGVSVKILCDTNHVMTSDYAEVEAVSAGADAVDFRIANLCEKGDIVVTQDYGVAAMALSRGAFAIHQSGMVYDNENIDRLLFRRFLTKEIRRSSSKNHLKGPKKRTNEDDKAFAESFEKLILKGMAK